MDALGDDARVGTSLCSSWVPTGLIFCRCRGSLGELDGCSAPLKAIWFYFRGTGFHSYFQGTELGLNDADCSFGHGLLRA